MKNARLKDYLTYSWYIILLVSLFSYALSYYLVSYVNEYERTEVFSLFVTSYEIKDNTLEQKIHEKYISYGINKVEIYNYSYDDKDISSYYSSFGEKSDLIILYESDLKDMEKGIKEKFKPIDEYSVECQTYKYEEVSYGIKIADTMYLSSCFEFKGKINNDSYILINNTSPHFTTSDSIGYHILNDLLKGDF